MRPGPRGFSHGAWPEPTKELNGYMKGITPAVRWSHYQLENGTGIALLDRDFEIGRDELTPSLKVKRNIVEQKYRAVIDGLYEEPEKA